MRVFQHDSNVKYLCHQKATHNVCKLTKPLKRSSGGIVRLFLVKSLQVLHFTESASTVKRCCSTSRQTILVWEEYFKTNAKKPNVMKKPWKVRARTIWHRFAQLIRSTVRSGAEERTFLGARLDVLIFRLRSYHVLISYSAESNGPKFYKTLMFLGQAGMFLSFQARRSSATRSSTSDLTVLHLCVHSCLLSWGAFG